MVDPIPWASSAPSPAALFTVPENRVPDSVIAQMEGIPKGCGRLLVCFNGQPNVGGFQGDHDIREIEILKNTDMIQRTFHHAVRRRVTVFFQHPFFQGSRVHSDPDGNPPFLGRLYHRLHLFPASDVPRVDADFIDPALDRFQGQTIVKMDVRHQRNRNFFFDGRDGFSGAHVRHRHPDHLTACLLQLADLLHRRLHVVGFGGGHTLDDHLVVAPDLKVSYLYRPRFPAMKHEINRPFNGKIG